MVSEDNLDSQDLSTALETKAIKAGPTAPHASYT